MSFENEASTCRCKRAFLSSSASASLHPHYILATSSLHPHYVLTTSSLHPHYILTTSSLPVICQRLTAVLLRPQLSLPPPTTPALTQCFVSVPPSPHIWLSKVKPAALTKALSSSRTVSACFLSLHPNPLDAHPTPPPHFAAGLFRGLRQGCGSCGLGVAEGAAWRAGCAAHAALAGAGA